MDYLLEILLLVARNINLVSMDFNGLTE